MGKRQRKVHKVPIGDQPLHQGELVVQPLAVSVVHAALAVSVRPSLRGLTQLVRADALYLLQSFTHPLIHKMDKEQMEGFTDLHVSLKNPDGIVQIE